VTDFVDVDDITDEYMRERLKLAKGYTLVLISQGPNWGTPSRDAIIWQHGRRNFGLRRQGDLAIVCPVRDDTPLCGLYIFNTDAETATAIMKGDPGILSGVFDCEVHPIIGFPGDSLPGRAADQIGGAARTQ
jgi:hypothetical protein